MSTHMASVSDPPHDPSGEPVTRTLLVIGGAEDKRRRVIVLKRFVRLAGGADSRIVVIPTASSMAEEAFEVYQSVFGRQRAQDVSVVNPASRQAAADPALIETIDAATGVFVTGGNQLKLGQLIVGTPLHDAITRAYHRGAVVGEAGHDLRVDRVGDETADHAAGSPAGGTRGGGGRSGRRGGHRGAQPLHAVGERTHAHHSSP